MENSFCLSEARAVVMRVTIKKLYFFVCYLELSTSLVKTDLLLLSLKV